MTLINSIAFRSLGLAADWPKNIGVCQTLAWQADQQPQFKSQPYGQQNFGLHVGDDPREVLSRRLDLLSALNDQGVKRICWLDQIHGTNVYDADNDQLGVKPPQADAAFTQQSGFALAIMTADCLPIVLSCESGKTIAAIHAGWRGLLAGVIEKTIDQVQSMPDTRLRLAWVGASISVDAFEVGESVKQQFVSVDPCYEGAFKTTSQTTYLANLANIAQMKLDKYGIDACFLPACSYRDKRFYSYRRNGQTGRMATLIYRK